ncbi:MAG: putative Ig domain-containing protein [Bryobacterales bacterium]|nr:putative Ig domain-containing protein [Bryobacterales bacterium]
MSIILVFIHLCAYAATYFVSPIGSDANAGVTPSAAWRSVAKVTATRLYPGDQVLFARGGVWSEPIVARWSGAPGNPIVYDAYGNGPKPMFAGSDTLTNSRFELVRGSIYRYAIPSTVNGLIADRASWFEITNAAAIDSRSQSFYWAAGYLYVNTGGSDPRTNGRSYAACVREDMVHSNYQHYLTFRNLVVTDTANLHAGYAFRVMGSSNVTLEDSEAYFAGRHHFGVINSTGFIGRNLKAARAMPGPDATFYVAFSDPNQGRRNDTSQFINCSGEKFENPLGRGHQIFYNHGGGLGPILIENMISRGGILSVGQDVPENTTTIRGGLIENAWLEIFANRAVVDGLTIRGQRGSIDNWGSDSLFQNLKLMDLNPAQGQAGDTAAITMRPGAQRNVVRFSTVTLSPTAPFWATCLSFMKKGLASKWYGNIFWCNGEVLKGLSAADGTDVTYADFNFYNAGANISGMSFTQWKTNFDQNSISAADPGFRNRAAGDLSLLPAAMVRNRASVPSHVFQPPLGYDVEGVVRPQGGGYDMGAHEALEASTGPPIIVSPATASGTVMTPFVYQISASNLPGSYDAQSLPPGLGVHRGTGAITGVPTAAGTFAVTVLASNGFGVGSATITITVLSDMSGLWKLDESGGAILVDASGNGNRGAIRGTGTWTSGRTGNALRLAGGSYVEIADSATLRPPVFTVAFWYRSVSNSGIQMLVSKPRGSGADNSFAIYLSSGTLTFHAANAVGFMSVAAPLAGQWVHVAVLRSTSNYQFYINGVLARTVTGGDTAYDNRSLLFGAEDDGRGITHFYTGDLDEVRLYQRGLLPAEIEALANPATAPADNSPPQVFLTSPTHNATVAGALQLVATASDPSGVAGVQFKLDHANLDSEDTTPPYSLHWDSRTTGNGAHTLSAIARDAEGNTATSSISIHVSNAPLLDGTLPEVTITAPVGGTVLKGLVQISASATDNAGVTAVQFRVDGGNLSEDTAAPYNANWDTTLSADGPHMISVIARDTAGNLRMATVAVTVANGPPVQPPPPSSSPVGHWTMDDGSGSTVSNARGSALYGGLVGPGAWTAGRIGRALRLSGGGHVRVEDAPDLRASNFTISLWFKAASTSAVQMLVSKPFGRSADNSVAIYLANGRIHFHTSGFAGAMSSEPVPAGVWTHLAIGKHQGTATMYVNGVVVSTAAAPETVMFDAQPLLFGAEDDGSGIMATFANGELDDVRLYNRGLTAAEVYSLVSSPVSTDSTPPAVSFLYPSTHSVHSGVVEVSAAAGDNVGVTSLRFLLDGAPLGVELSAPPYRATWNTALTADGQHTITAEARDAAGNRGSASVTVTASNVDPDLVGHWRMDQPAGSTVPDATANAEHGSLAGAGTWITGPRAGAIHLERGAIVTVPDSAGLRPQNFTLAFWFRTNMLQGTQVLLAKPVGSGTDNSYCLYLWQNFLVFHTSSYSGAMRAAVAAKTWQHVAVVKSGATVSLYVNAALVATAGNAANPVAYSARPLLMGADDYSGRGAYSGFLNGDLDDVRLYKRALTPIEIQALTR